MVPPQHVVDQVRIHRHLLPRFLRAWMVPLDEPGNHRDVAKRPPQHRAFRQPRLQIVAQHVLIEQLRHVARLLRRPHTQHIVRRNEPKRCVTRTLHAPGQQHSQRLMRISTLEAVCHQVPAVAAQERLHQQIIASRQPRPRLLQLQPMLHAVRKQPPARRVLQQPAHTVGKVGGEREPAAFIGRYHRLAGAAIRAFHRVLVQPQETQQASGEHERVARTQEIDEILFHLAQQRAMAPTFQPDAP